MKCLYFSGNGSESKKQNYGHVNTELLYFVQYPILVCVQRDDTLRHHYEELWDVQD